MKKLIYLLLLIMTFALISCSDDDGSDKTAGTIWQEIDPSVVYPDFTFDGLAPSCSNCPAYTDLDGVAHEAGNPAFKFFFREGSSNNLVIYFQGGGACWATENCLYEHTYSEELQAFESVDFLDMLSSGLGEDIGYGGIFKFVDESNPLKDWDFVYIPYCTGDLHGGANDYDYPSASVNTAIIDQFDGVAQTIRHRGEVNFQVVLKWITDNRSLGSGDKIFVTGISGGCYGAMLNFSNVCEAFPGSKTYLLGDAGNGFVPSGFLAIAADRWGLVMPSLTEFGGSSFDTIKISDFYTILANHYTGSRIAQYTTRYDNTQSWFYNIMLGDTINYPETWSAGENAEPDPIHFNSALTWADIVNQWSTGMLALLDETSNAVTGDNYRYYVAAGRDHTVLMSVKFYTEESGGYSFLQWVDDFISGDTIPANGVCTSCGGPVTGKETGKDACL